MSDAPNGATDAFLFKLNASFGLAYATYIGGHGADVAYGVAADASGNAYVAGQTAAGDFPRTVGPAVSTTTPNGFVIKINTTVPGANSKVWATLIGGNGNDVANAIIVDGSGRVTVAGSTSSTDFAPTSAVGYSPAKTNGSNVDGFIERLDATGGNSVYFSYWPFGPIKAMAGSGNVIYLTGQTNGNILTTSSNAYQASGGANHAFMTKVDTSVGGANSILYSSYLAGAGVDTGLGIAFDSLGRGYVVGTTTSPAFPTTPGSIPTPSVDALPDAFYTVLSTTSAPGLPGLLFSTYLGGNANDAANAVAVDANGNVVITGNSTSTNFIGLLGSGVFAVKLGGSGSSQTPTPSSLNPVASSGSSQIYTFQFSDLDGWQDLDVVNVVMNFALDGRSACYVGYSRPQNVLYLVGDDGGALQALPLNGTGGAVSNSQCTISRLGSSASGSGATLTLTLDIAFSSAFGGNKVIYMASRDIVANNSGWYTMGVHGVPPLPANFPKAISMNPASGAVSAANITFTYQDQTDARNLQTAWALMNTALDGGHACYVAYYQPGNSLYLLPDNGDASQATSMVLNGSATSLSNSQCTILGTGSGASVSGSLLNVRLNMVFKQAFSGFKGVWMAEQTIGGQIGDWQSLGAWRVP